MDQQRRQPLHARLQAAEIPESLTAECAEIERCLLVLARFTGGRRHHATTLQVSGAGRLESAGERRARRTQARERWIAEPPPAWWSPDRLAYCAPLGMHPARQVDAGLYPVLAVIEDLNRARPVDVARALTLDRSTVSRHIDTLEQRGLVFRERGGTPKHLRSRVGLTAAGFSAMKTLREARISRLVDALGDEPRLERRLMVLSLRRLAQALHGEAALRPLPRPLLEPNTRDCGLQPRALHALAGRLGKKRRGT